MPYDVRKIGEVARARYEARRAKIAARQQSEIARLQTLIDRWGAKASKAARKGRIFIDYLRNEDSATAIASYSLRARRRATVATPLGWAEVDERLDPQAFTLTTVPERIRTGADPWAGMDELHQRLPVSVGGR